MATLSYVNENKQNPSSQPNFFCTSSVRSGFQEFKRKMIIRDSSLSFLACCWSLLILFGVELAFVDSFSSVDRTNRNYRSLLKHSNNHSSAIRSERMIDIRSATTALCSSSSQEPFGQQQQPQTSPKAVLLVGGFQSREEEQGLLHALAIAGYDSVEISTASRLDLVEQMKDDGVYFYELSRATGMLKLVSSSDAIASGFDAPTWVPMVRGEENVLVANGWSFLDPDESEPMSAYDIDDANAEAEYKPQWGQESNITQQSTSALPLSPIGYDLSPLSKETILSEAESLANDFSRDVLLHGKTDPPNTKLTSNGYDFRGSTGQSDIPQGIFCAAIGGLPLFCSKDLAATTASSGWLSFGRPLDTAHVIHITPDPNSFDQRIEVVCARSKCHLGHYFGPTEGYCINASALRFVPSVHDALEKDLLPKASRPISWRPLDEEIPRSREQLSPSLRVLKSVLETHGSYERIALGAGCFWHVEEALRKLQGVVETQACYAGGHSTAPTYRAVCEGTTGHAEVVSVVYDPAVCPTNVLVDCFLALHDPTMVKAHGKHALQTGQYRSCVFVQTQEAGAVAKQCLEDCHLQLGKELSTEIRNMAPHQTANSASFGEGWCWRAEDEHQRHDERIQKAKGIFEAFPVGLPATEWLQEYGRRIASTMGGSLESALDPDDDGMAMMMI